MSEKQNLKNEESKLTCGIIMPIAASQSYTEEHWKNVLNIIKSAIEKTDRFTAVPVWENFKSDVIHDTIINNILKCDVVICDISTTNPNVMYELGLRMTIKKPVVIIKDDTTKAPFDTNMIRYEIYPKDLHYFKIQTFIYNICKILNNTWDDYQKAPDEFTQLVNLQEFKKYKIVTDTGEAESLTVEEAFNFLCQLIRNNNTSAGNSTNLRSTDLKSATWEIKGDLKEIEKYIVYFTSKLRTLLQEPKEKSDQLIDEEIDGLVEKFTVFSNSLDTFIKTVEGISNE